MKAYRYEFKYETDRATLTALESRLCAFMPRDPHAGPDGTYTIRSLYFDDWQDQCLHDNENGTDPREKLRLRIYNADPTLIHLECKRREHDMTGKLQETVSEELCRRILSGEKLSWEDTGDSPLLRKFLYQQRTRLLKPKILVEYERTPFLWSDGNVRITLDRNMRGSTRREDFLKKETYFRPVMPPGRELLEVKYDEFLPDAIAHVVEDRKLRRVAYSKYALCRRLCG